MSQNKVYSTTSQIRFKNLATFAVKYEYFYGIMNCKLNFKKVSLGAVHMELS